MKSESLDQRLKFRFRFLTPVHLAAFLACLLVGYAVHLYAFTNLIPNSDGLSRVYDLQEMTVSGRWFLHYVSSFNLFTQMPAAIGLLSMLFLGLAAVLITEILGLRSRVLAAFTGAVMAAFPCLGYTFLYLFTASDYCFAILLAVGSVFLAGKGKWWSLAAAAVLLAFSMGIYQAYAAVAVTLSLLTVVLHLLREEATFRSTLKLGLKMVAYLAVGAALYYGILQIFLAVKDLELLSYLGMDAASSSYPLSQLPALILTCYKQAAAFFFLPDSENSFADTFMVVLNGLLVLLGAFLFLRVLLVRKREAWRWITGFVLILLLPVAMDFGQILSPYSTPTPIMKYAFVCAYLLVICLCDDRDDFRFSVYAGYASLVTVAVLLVAFLNTNNLLYTASAQAHRATESYATRLLTRIESCEGYTPGMEIAIVGAIPSDQIQSDIASYSTIRHYSVPVNNVATLNKHIYYYLSDWLNFPVEEPDEETMEEIAASEEFQAMPLYPAQGSVQVLDGRVVVRMRETYTPKSDFEVAYENRR